MLYIMIESQGMDTLYIKETITTKYYLYGINFSLYELLICFIIIAVLILILLIETSFTDCFFENDLHPLLPDV